MLRRALLIARHARCWLPAAAEAGTFEISGSTIIYNGEDGVDQISGFDTGTSIRFTRFGGVVRSAGPGCNSRWAGSPSTARRTASPR